MTFSQEPPWRRGRSLRYLLRPVHGRRHDVWDAVLISTRSSDPDGASLNGLQQQFLGDYIAAVSDSRGGRVFAIWTDSRNAGACAVVDAYRSALAAGASVTAPDVITQCPRTFGNTDIYFMQWIIQVHTMRRAPLTDVRKVAASPTPVPECRQRPMKRPSTPRIEWPLPGRNRRLNVRTTVRANVASWPLSEVRPPRGTRDAYSCSELRLTTRNRLRPCSRGVRYSNLS
jgi:hypothetical protein